MSKKNILLLSFVIMILFVSCEKKQKKQKMFYQQGNIR